MGRIYLELPRLTVAVDLPDRLDEDFRRNFSFALAARRPSHTDHDYLVRAGSDGVALLKDGSPLASFTTPADLMFSLEEDLENALLDHRGSWVAFHAGAAARGEAAVMVVGRPDTGKTTTTFQLVELGLDLLCEEVALVDAATGQVQPFPQSLTLARHYAEAFRERYPVARGTLTWHGTAMARYAADAVRTRAAPLRVVLFPAYEPSCEPQLEELSPGRALADLLPHCFQPSGSDERLFDDVIRLIEPCALFVLRSRDIESARLLLAGLVARLA
jgi:hypothetical protein